MWYSARLLYEMIALDERKDHEPFFEEKLIALQCAQPEDIGARLAVVSQRDESEYENSAGYLVRWVFREVLEVQEVMADTIADGTEVFFRFWTNPTEQEFEVMRRTHENPWWLAV